MSSSFTYESVVDILQLFKDKKEITKAFTYILTNLIKYSMVIKEDGNKIPYPIVYQERFNCMQVDYQMFIYFLAQHAMEQSGENYEVFNKVLYHFGLFPKTVKSKFSKNSKSMLTSYLEVNLAIINNMNYKRQVQYMEHYTPKILQFNDINVEYKSIMLNQIGLSKYINYDDFIEDYSEYIFQNSVKEVAFGKMNMQKYWHESDQEKLLYFMINIEDTGAPISLKELYEMQKKLIFE